MEDYPSPAEGNGLENRQACKSVRGFESHILLIIKTFSVGSIPTARVSKVANVVKWLTHQIVALTFGGSIPLIRLYFWGIAKR